jgi:Tol biopolymer transport system component
VTTPHTGAVRFTVVKRILAIVPCLVAPVVLSACGSSDVAPHGPGSIVFVAGAQTAGFGVDNTELVAVTPSGRVRDLTSSADFELNATWSPDGSRVVFFRRPAATKETDGAEALPGIYVWVPGGGTPQRIASCSVYCHWYSFAWSPDNRQIAFVSEGGDAAIKVMNADGSGIHTVCDAKRCGGYLSGPTWSPDGRLVFADWVLGAHGIEPPGAVWIANADGSGVKQLTQPNCPAASTLRPSARGCARDGGPVWSPNGRLIAFIRTRAALPGYPQGMAPRRAPSIEVIRADGSHLRSISLCNGARHLGCYVSGPIAWAPDGKAIAYTQAASDHPSSFRITTLAGKTTTVRTCVSRCMSPSGLTWSPNGKRLAFVATFRTTNRSVWVIGRDGDGLHRVSRGGSCCLAWVRNASLSG